MKLQNPSSDLPALRSVADRAGRIWSVSVEAAPRAELIFRHGPYTLAAPYPSIKSVDALTDAELYTALGQARPSTRLCRERTFRSEEHGFFDELVIFLAAAFGLGIGLEAATEGRAIPYASHDAVGLSGTWVSQLTFVGFPAEVLAPIAANGWPAQIRLFEIESPPVPPEGVKDVEPSARTATLLAGAAFLQYYERALDGLVARHGPDPLDWAAPWPFARLVRNAVAHGGLLDIRNPKAPSAEWRALRYSPEDNGQPVLFRDIAAVELVLLMEDMNSVLHAV